jgi:hypothetical protein
MELFKNKKNYTLLNLHLTMLGTVTVKIVRFYGCIGTWVTDIIG